MSNLLNQEEADQEVIYNLRKTLRKLTGDSIIMKAVFFKDADGNIKQAHGFEDVTREDLLGRLESAQGAVAEAQQDLDSYDALAAPTAPTQPEQPAPAPETPIDTPQPEVPAPVEPQTVTANGVEVPVNNDGNVIIDPTPETPAPAAPQITDVTPAPAAVPTVDPNNFPVLN